MRNNTAEIIEQNKEEFDRKRQEVYEALVNETPDEVLRRIESSLMQTFILEDGMSRGTRQSELGSILFSGIQVLRETLIQVGNWIEENCLESIDADEPRMDEKELNRHIEL